MDVVTVRTLFTLTGIGNPQVSKFLGQQRRRKSPEKPLQRVGHVVLGEVLVREDRAPGIPPQPFQHVGRFQVRRTLPVHPLGHHAVGRHKLEALVHYDRDAVLREVQLLQLRPVAARVPRAREPKVPGFGVLEEDGLEVDGGLGQGEDEHGPLVVDPQGVAGLAHGLEDDGADLAHVDRKGERAVERLEVCVVAAEDQPAGLPSTRFVFLES